MPLNVKNFIPRRFRSNAVEIPALALHGTITQRHSPLSNSINFAQTAYLLQKAFANKEAPAIALIVNSPGGAPVQSHLIFKRIRQLAEEHGKRVFAFVEDVAASGGYMIACAADEIYADPSSIVGSIGVISSSFGFPKLLEKIGVERRIYTAGENKSVLDPFLPENQKDVEHLKSLQQNIHAHFIEIVKTRRKDKLKEDSELFTGLFWAGEKAAQLGLIDGLGDASSILKQRYGKETKLYLVSPPKSLWQPKNASAIKADSVKMLAHETIEQVLEHLTSYDLWSRYGL